MLYPGIHEIHHRVVTQIILVGVVLGIDGVLLEHVPLPVILSWEALCTQARVLAAGLSAVELARLFVLVVDVPLQMRNGAEAPIALLALPRPFVVPLVVATEGMC